MSVRFFGFVFLALSACTFAGIADCSADEWTGFRSDEHRFEIRFPVAPKESDSPGNALFLSATHPERLTVFQVQVFLVPDIVKANTTILLNSLIMGRDAAVKAVNGTLVSDCEIKLGNAPGREFAMTAVQDEIPQFICARTIAAEGRLYLFQAIQPGDEPLNARDLMEFWGSFRLSSSPANPEPPPGLAGTPFGEWAASGTLSFRIVKAEVARVQVYRTIYRDYVWSDNSLLRVQIEIRNGDERKIVRRQNTLLQKPFGIVDDVQNVIRLVGLPVATEPVGRLPEDADINPGQTKMTVDLWIVPPPKTRSLTLLVNHEAFTGMPSSVLLQIPSDKIAGFKPPSP